jgi:hypothetical protein
VQTVRKWLDNWTGIGHVVTGMQRQDYNLELARYNGRGWHATFFVTGMMHSLMSLTGTTSEQTPWRAVQVAAWNALGKTPAEADEATPAEDVILP